MSSSIPKTFKVSFEKSGETRRIPATGSYGELSKCLSSIWGDHPFVLTYTDEDGDKIAVSSEMEFDEAMSVARDMGSAVLKFNAYTNSDALRSHLNQDKKTKCSTTQSSELPVHVGIVCDRSGMNPIVGTRYHVPGADYDLCEEEFEKLPETERVLFVKIETPVTHRGGGCCGRRGRFGGRMMPPMMASMGHPAMGSVSVDELALQASIAASIFDSLKSGNNEDTPPPFAQVLNSFVDAAGAAAVAAANKKDNPQASQGTNPLADLLGAIRQDISQGSSPCKPQGCSGGGGKCQEAPSSENKKCERFQKHCEKMKEHFMNMQKEQASNGGGVPAGHPLAALFSGLFDPSQNPCVQTSGGGASSLSSSPSAVHFGVECDKSGMNPIVGIRYVIPGANYDLCAEEFEKLPESERVLYSKIVAPGQTPIPCMQPEEEAQEEEVKKPTPSTGAAEVDSDDDMYSDESDSDDYEGTVKPIVAKSKKNPPAPVVEAPKKDDEVSEPQSEDALFANQLVELAAMGFVDRDTNLALLKRYQGRVERVVNSILEL